MVVPTTVSLMQCPVKSVKTNVPLCCVCSAAKKARADAGALVVHQAAKALVPTASGAKKEYVPSAQLAKRLPSAWPRPAWHAPWKNYRVVSGHLGCAEPFCLLPTAVHLFA